MPSPYYFFPSRAKEAKKQKKKEKRNNAWSQVNLNLLWSFAHHADKYKNQCSSDYLRFSFYGYVNGC